MIGLALLLAAIVAAMVGVGWLELDRSLTGGLCLLVLAVLLLVAAIVAWAGDEENEKEACRQGGGQVVVVHSQRGDSWWCREPDR